MSESCIVVLLNYTKSMQISIPYLWYHLLRKDRCSRDDRYGPQPHAVRAMDIGLKTLEILPAFEAYFMPEVWQIFKACKHLSRELKTRTCNLQHVHSLRYINQNKRTRRVCQGAGCKARTLFLCFKCNISVPHVFTSPNFTR